MLTVEKTLAALITAVVAVAGFAAFGPLGVGSGPVTIAAVGGFSYNDSTGAPVGFLVPIRNASGSGAVIDRVTVTSNAGPRVKVLTAYAGYATGCAGALEAWRDPAQSGSAGWPGCEIQSASVATHRSIPAHSYPDRQYWWRDHATLALLIKFASPPPNNCQVARQVSVSYHQGWRTYTTTKEVDLRMCGPHSAS